jgi:hypothetical protein
MDIGFRCHGSPNISVGSSSEDFAEEISISSRYRCFDQACLFCADELFQCLRPSYALPLASRSLGWWRSEREELLDCLVEAFCPGRLRSGRSQVIRRRWRLLECAWICPPEVTHRQQLEQEVVTSIAESPCAPLELRDDACSGSTFVNHGGR